MQIVKLTPEHAAAIREHGQQTYPHECCGILLGRDDADAGLRTVSKLLPVENDRAADERHNRFTIPPLAYMQAEKAARAEQLDVLGFYHSHPDAPAKPSAYDIEHAWPYYSYVIVAIEQGQAKLMTCWRLQEDRSQFNEQMIEEEE